MGFRFYRRFPLFPGLRLNLSRSGVSASIGRRGSWVTLGPAGVRATVGGFGTGLFYTSLASWRQLTTHGQRIASDQGHAEPVHIGITGWLIWLLAAWAIIGPLWRTASGG